MRKKIALFAALILLQMAFSFVAPTSGTNDCWKPLEVVGSYKGRSFDSFDQALMAKVGAVIANYRLVCDGGGHMVLAHDFPQDYFRGRLLFINRPLYPALVSLIAAPLHLFSNSYSTTFAAAILFNFALFLATTALFYYLVQKFFSERVAFISALLLIFSPFAHSWLIQPETNVFGMFSLLLSLFLLYKFNLAPTNKKLVLYSLLVGITMVGRMNFLISIIILLIALFGKKFKEAAAFFVLHAVPFLAWYLWATKVWGLGFGMQEVTTFGAGIWIFQMLSGPAYKIVGEFVGLIPNVFSAIIYAFLLVPVVFSLVGWRVWLYEKKNLLYFGLMVAYLVFAFTLRLFLPRHAFSLFVIIYPTAVLGIDWLAEKLKQFKFFRTEIYYGLVYLLIIGPALLDVFRIYEYLGVPYS